MIDQARQDIADEQAKRELIQLIETILIYKLPNKSREEIEQMLGLSELKQTKVYQEAKQEGKLESVPRLLQLGLTIEQIAMALELEVEVVTQAAQSSVSDTKH